MIDYQYLAGGLTDTPEIRFTPSGRGLVNFTLAQSDSRKNDADEWETTNNRYVPITLWDTDRIKWTDALAGLEKGTKLVVQGKLITRTWEAKDGTNRSRLEFQARHAYLDAATGAQQTQQGQGSGWIAQDSRGGFEAQGTDEQPPF
ncbi:single-stranded DNA-binding protein [Corynebacterium sanguinis]|uniref:single-stranded DNA-binding protein n=1 Tax=Corynebacterium sanguinis TaxID=2594913 RepID=UPI0021A3AB1B|nr:single-stranded DNA-binding protein [Corynebacterium sanguinis]MCT1411673.1 single-stranded DNA-binding protein [Corynebacterium sanguinis]